MYKKKIVYFPLDDSMPRIYVNPQNENSLMRSMRAVHLTPDMEKTLNKVPLHRWKFDAAKRTIIICDIEGERRLLESHSTPPRSLKTWEWSAIFSIVSVLSGLIGYFIGKFI